jgi:membrane protein required for colicin V production
MDIAVIDVVFLGIIAIFAIRCAIRGLVSELMSMAALVFGILSAIFFFRKAAEIVRGRFMPDIKTLPEIISFIAIFIIVFVVIKFLESILKEIIAGIHLSGPDRFLGFILGLAEGVIIVCLLLFLINIQFFVDSSLILEKSFFADLLMPFIIGEKKFIESNGLFVFKGGWFTGV